MSLTLGKLFVSALRASSTLQQALGGTIPQGGTTYQGARIFAVARDDKAEAEDKIPYLIMMPAGINTDGSKDEYEECDRCTINLLCVAAGFSDLITLCNLVSSAIKSNLASDATTIVDDYTFSASPVSYDPTKPCYYITLTYIVNTQSV